MAENYARLNPRRNRKHDASCGYQESASSDRKHDASCGYKGIMCGDGG
jgi:hypothetical protein